MLCEYIAKGKTIDDAVANGLEKIGLERDDVSIEVLETPEKGFFGIGASPAVVKLSYEGIAPVITEEPEVEQKVDKKADKADKKAEKKAEKAEKKASKNKKGFKKAESSTEFVSEVIKLMGYEDLDIEASESENGLDVTVSGEEAGSLIGHRGETLNALQYLVSLFENRENEDYSKINLDILGYREKRKVTLEKLARRMAITAVKSHRNIYLDPMPNYERKIIHAALQDFNGVSTYSTGVEPARKVVIAYSGGKGGKHHGKRGNGGYRHSGINAQGDAEVKE
ncbi:MAG: protein jag [Clostridia bacterium]|nr:protein jag [Clostridia bacterium]MBR2327237.1 protein jag [Clostridia bacterium]